MSIDVTVYHGSGNTQAPDIINLLSSSIHAATSLGQKFLAESYGLQVVKLVCAADIAYVPGLLIEVVDGRQGKTWYGMISDVVHTINTTGESPILETTLDVLKKAPA